jgi:hypothetical protein
MLTTGHAKLKVDDIYVSYAFYTHTPLHGGTPNSSCRALLYPRQAQSWSSAQSELLSHERPVGAGVGESVGLFVGESVGLFVGESVGLFIGLFVGELVGLAVGLFVGESVGLFVGESVGLFVGESVAEQVA